MKSEFHKIYNMVNGSPLENEAVASVGGNAKTENILKILETKVDQNDITN
jgi:hypothetical protein